MKRYLITILLLIWITVPAYGSDNCFPGEKHILSSPSGKYELVWRERNSQNEPHHLLLRHKEEGELHEVLEFYNQACAHWSPDEKYFSVSHYVGSNVAEDYVFESDNVSYRMNVMDLLPREVSRYYRKGILHGYIDTLAWNNDGLFIRAYGDRENKPRAFDVTLKCTLDKDKWTCRKTTAKKAPH